MIAINSVYINTMAVLTKKIWCNLFNKANIW